MSARDDYPKALSGFYLEARPDVDAMYDEIDRLRAEKERLETELWHRMANEKAYTFTKSELEDWIIYAYNFGRADDDIPSVEQIKRALA